MIRRFRKWLIGRQIKNALHDQQWYLRHADAAMYEAQRAVIRETLLRQKLTEVDFPLPRILRTRGLT